MDPRKNCLKLNSEALGKPIGSQLNKSLPSVFRIRIQRIHMFLTLSDPDPLVRGMDPDPAPDPDPSNHQAKLARKTLVPTVF